MTVDRGVDTPPPTGTDDDIATRIRAAVDAGELRGVTGGPVERLGAGESYTAWRIGSGEQARVLRQELEARQAAGQAVLVEAVARDSERYQRDGDLPADQVELQLRRELCAGEVSKAFPSACRPFRR